MRGFGCGAFRAVLSAAVGMAMAATADRQIQVGPHRAEGNAVVPVDFTKREGIVAHLEALEPHAHPAQALTPFFAAVLAGGLLADVVVVTGEDVAADKEFRQALAAMKLSAVLVATVSRQGQFRLISCGSRKNRVVCEARLKLEDVLAPRGRPGDTLIDERSSERRPAVFHLKPFPLRLPYRLIDLRSVGWPRACRVYLARSLPGRVGPSRVGCPITGRLRACRHRSLGRSGFLRLDLRGRGGTASTAALWLLRVDVFNGAHFVVPLEVGTQCPIAVCGHGGRIFVVYRDRAEMFGTSGGSPVQTIVLPQGLVWRRDRFFDHRDWYALSYDGLARRLEPPAPLDSSGDRNPYLTFVDVPDCGGPVGIGDNGDLFYPSDKRRERISQGLPAKVRLQAVARNGKRVMVAPWNNPSDHVLIELPGRAARRVSGDLGRAVEREIHELVTFNTLRHRLAAIYVSDEGSLTLVSPRGAHLHISLNPAGQQMRCAPLPTAMAIIRSGNSIRCNLR